MTGHVARLERIQRLGAQATIGAFRTVSCGGRAVFAFFDTLSFLAGAFFLLADTALAGGFAGALVVAEASRLFEEGAATRALRPVDLPAPAI